MKIDNTMIMMAQNSTNPIIDLGNSELYSGRIGIYDHQIADYVALINKLSTNGVNIRKIYDYKLKPYTKISTEYGDSSEGIFLFEKAKGNQLEHKCIGIEANDDADLEEYKINFLSSTEKYLLELEARANASIEIYERLVKDYLTFQEEKLMPDILPVNFSFDNNKGFYVNSITPMNTEIDIQTYIRLMEENIFGIGRPHGMIGTQTIYGLPKEMAERLKKSIATICAKIIFALKKQNIDSKVFMNFIQPIMQKIDAVDNFDEYLENIFEQEKNNKKRLG